MMPPRECSPNGGWSWRERADAKAEWREQAGTATQVAVMQNFDAFCWVPSAPEIIIDIEIAWCCGRKRMDDDNAITACKPARDGIADVLLDGDDRKLRTGRVTQKRGEGIVTFVLRDAA